MRFYITIPLEDKNPDYSSVILPCIRDIFSRAQSDKFGPYYFFRTWDEQSSAEVARICINEISETDAGNLVRVFKRLGCEIFTELKDDSDVSQVLGFSPLWNSGFGGSNFTERSIDLVQKVSPILATMLNECRGAPDSLTASLQVLRLMVIHVAATLKDSPQMAFEEYDFKTLLSLRLLSYRSHYEAVLLRTNAPEAFERACSKFYEKVGPYIRNQIISAGQSLELSQNNINRRWYEFVTTESAGLARAFENSEIVDAGRTLEDLEKALGRSVEPTRFHSKPTSHMQRLLHEDIDFLVYRLQTSLLYSSIHSLGFSLAERYVFCYVVARANEDLAGKPMLELQDDLDGLAKRLEDTGSPSVGYRI